MKKKYDELNPEAEEIYPIQPKKETTLEDAEIKTLIKQMDAQNISINNDSAQTSDSFFRYMARELFSKNEISTKTEYLSVTENFVGSKLEFLSRYGGMPYLAEFVEIFELKRVSLQRKGRKEIIMALNQRQQELEAERLKQMQNMGLGMGLQ